MAAKKIKDKKPNVIGLLASKMVSDIYPVLFNSMEELSDTDITHNTNNIRIDLSIIGNIFEITYVPDGNYSNRIVEDMIIGKDTKCPFFEKHHLDSNQYIAMSEYCILILEDLRKRKIKVLEIIEKIDSLTTKLTRFVIIEKYKK